ncbi:MAG: SCP2 sterol-binding domain-containing protein [Hyphomonas sp.]|nr:SCP2 sterol-binding domain-containing protein [Hyphomonas sp.]
MHWRASLDPKGAKFVRGAGSRLSCVLVQPLLSHVVRRIGDRHPSVFARLGSYKQSAFLIDAVELPFALHLCPNPKALAFRAVPRDRAPHAEARIRGRFMLLLELVDSERDGDAAFFSRDLDVSGDTEAVVRLRNALDDVEGSIAEEAAGVLGAPGRAILARLRRAYKSEARGGSRHESR